MELMNKDFLIWEKSKTEHTAVVYNRYKRNRVNEALGYYYGKNSSFCDDDEPLFIIPNKEMKNILSILVKHPEVFDGQY